MAKDYYQILEISPDTNQELIKVAAQTRANEINEAFRVLSDPLQRQAYDESRHSVTRTSSAAVASAPAMAINTASAPETTKVYRSSVQFSQNRRRQLSTEGAGVGIGSMGGVLSKLKIDGPSSAKEIIILVLAIVFLGYVASDFFVPLNERIGNDLKLEFKTLDKQKSPMN